MARSDDLACLRPAGLYGPAGDFYIDPWRPVERAVVTHAHGDHARTERPRDRSGMISGQALVTHSAE
jgi:hypothetical protein